MITLYSISTWFGLFTITNNCNLKIFSVSNTRQCHFIYYIFSFFNENFKKSYDVNIYLTSSNWFIFQSCHCGNGTFDLPAFFEIWVHVFTE